MPATKEIASPGRADYAADLHAWVQEQAAVLRARNPQALDWENLAEEIDSMGASQERELLSRLTVILEHLLKLQFGLRAEPRAGRRRTIGIQRIEIGRLLERNPSLRPKVPDALSRVYPDARSLAIDAFAEHEPGEIAHYRASLPETPPYRADDVLARDFFPGPEA